MTTSLRVDCSSRKTDAKECIHEDNHANPAGNDALFITCLWTNFQSGCKCRGNLATAGRSEMKKLSAKRSTRSALSPLKTDKRYDFAFKTSVRGEEWKFSMSAVLSRNGKTVWVMAWLDEIPSRASEVPRTSLLRLLAANDRMGNGKFFAYIPTNKRFVLQRVLKNEQMTNKKLMAALQDLALSVADEYPTWSVAKWVPKTDGNAPQVTGGVPQPSNVGKPNTTTANQSSRTQTSEAASKFSDRRVQ